MFLKCRQRRKDGKTHRSWSIVESRRYAGNKVAHRHVLYLGEINDSQRVAWERTIAVIDERDGEARQLALFPADRTPPPGEVDTLQVRLSELSLENPRQWGACWLGDQLWQQLRLDTFFGERLPASRESTDWEKVVRILTIYRLLSPGSEWRLHRHWFGTTALGDLLGVDARAVQDDTLYRALDLLLEHKEALFTHLHERWRDLFAARYEILLYDLTSTYFECDVPAAENDPRRFGYSRDKRGDCVQVVIALVVTPEGLPLAYEMLPGNTADKTTLRGMLATITRRYGAAERIWVMDRGVPTEEILGVTQRAGAGPLSGRHAQGTTHALRGRAGGTAVAGRTTGTAGQTAAQRRRTVRPRRKRCSHRQGTQHAPPPAQDVLETLGRTTKTGSAPGCVAQETRRRARPGRPHRRQPGPGRGERGRRASLSTRPEQTARRSPARGPVSAAHEHDR